MRHQNIESFERGSALATVTVPALSIRMASGYLENQSTIVKCGRSPAMVAKHPPDSCFCNEIGSLELAPCVDLCKHGTLDLGLLTSKAFSGPSADILVDAKRRETYNNKMHLGFDP